MIYHSGVIPRQPAYPLPQLFIIILGLFAQPLLLLLQLCFGSDLLASCRTWLRKQPEAEPSRGSAQCSRGRGGGWEGLLRSACAF